MLDVALERFAYIDMGTFGRLMVGDFCCVTVERAWIDNHRNISCIPEGARYHLELGTFHEGGYPAYEVLDVPGGRTEIKIHVPNRADDVEGASRRVSVWAW